MSNSLAVMHPELVREWSEKNFPLTPDKITYGSNKIVWWKAVCGHEWQTSVKGYLSCNNITGYSDLLFGTEFCYRIVEGSQKGLEGQYF